MPVLSQLVDFAALLPRQIDLDVLLERAAETIAGALDAERATIWLVDTEENGLVTRVAVLPEVHRLVQPMGQGIAGHVAVTGEHLKIDSVEDSPLFDSSADEKTGYRTRNVLASPIRDRDSGPIRGVLQVLNKRAGFFSDAELQTLRDLGEELAEIFGLTTLRAGETQAHGLKLRGRCNQVVGISAPMEAVYQRVSLSAGTDATVLLTGETGTGKSVIAHAIDDNSLRASGPFVTLDATTLPAQLIESELFGHERGAFTGAGRRVIGKAE